MSLKGVWNEYIGAESGKYSVAEVQPPRPNSTEIMGCRRTCRQNACHCYGVTWGCPPGVGSNADCLSALNTFPKCIVISKRVKVSIKDRCAVMKLAGEMQNTLRKFNLFAREHGYRTLALADGGCNNCEKCSYPEPCRNPDMMIPSFGGYGVMIVDYLESNSIDVPFEEDAVTFRCLVLYDDKHAH